MSHDRVGADEFLITHESLDQVLGSRRAAVTAGLLQAAGLIMYHPRQFDHRRPRRGAPGQHT